MAVGDASTRSLEHTPTWAYATVCFVFIFISIILERSIHILTGWLKRRKKTALSNSVEKLKSELMLLGFMSLLLTVIQKPISNICIPSKLADTMLPCRKEADATYETTVELQVFKHIATATFSNLDDIRWRPPRRLADDESAVSEVTDKCSSEGKVSLLTEEGIHQLHIFIFALALMQIVYCLLTMALGREKMRRWKVWEKETQTTEYQAANDPNRFRITRETTFGRRHITSCTESSVPLWIKCFFRQFFHSVEKVDYLTLRHGFISAHLSAKNNNFNFQKYIQRALEEDFKVIVSISPLMWFIVVIVTLVDVHGWHVYLWVSYISLLIVLVLGTKLEVVVATMALQISNRNTVIRGTPLVEPNDNLFWFGRPKFVLTLLHFTLFMNAFELAFLIWVTIQFGVNSCYNEHTGTIVTRVVLAVTVQVLCSYITLPLYALVTQMGSTFNGKVVVEEQMTKILKQWHTEVKVKVKVKGKGKGKVQQSQTLQSPRASLSMERSSISGGSPNELPSSHRVSISFPSDSIQYYSEGEIVEEQEDKVTDFASSSSMARSGTGIQEMPMVKRH